MAPALTNDGACVYGKRTRKVEARIAPLGKPAVAPAVPPSKLGYFAISVTRVSRIIVTLISPG